MHHSSIAKEKGDAVNLDASSASRLESNLEDTEKGPLPEDMVQALDAAWLRIKGPALKDFH